MSSYSTGGGVSNRPYPPGWSDKIRQLVLRVDPSADGPTVQRALGLMYGLFLQAKTQTGHASPPAQLAREALEIARKGGQ